MRGRREEKEGTLVGAHSLPGGMMATPGGTGPVTSPMSWGVRLAGKSQRTFISDNLPSIAYGVQSSLGSP